MAAAHGSRREGERGLTEKQKAVRMGRPEIQVNIRDSTVTPTGELVRLPS